MDIEALRIVVALRPGHDVRGAQQGRIGDARHRAALAPISEQRPPEDILADALDDDPFGLRSARQPRRLLKEGLQRRVWQADAKLVVRRSIWNPRTRTHMLDFKQNASRFFAFGRLRQWA